MFSLNSNLGTAVAFAQECPGEIPVRPSPLSAIVRSFQGGLIEKLERCDRALRVREVAEILHVSIYTIYRLSRVHAIPGCLRVGGSIRFNPQALASWMREAGGAA